MVHVVVARDKHDGVEQLEPTGEKPGDLAVCRVREPLAVDDVAQHHQVPRPRLRAVVKRVQGPVDARAGLLVAVLLAAEVDVGDNEDGVGCVVGHSARISVG